MYKKKIFFFILSSVTLSNIIHAAHCNSSADSMFDLLVYNIGAKKIKLSNREILTAKSLSNLVNQETKNSSIENIRLLFFNKDLFPSLHFNQITELIKSLQERKQIINSYLQLDRKELKRDTDLNSYIMTNIKDFFIAKKFSSNQNNDSIENLERNTYLTTLDRIEIIVDRLQTTFHIKRYNQYKASQNQQGLDIPTPEEFFGSEWNNLSKFAKDYLQTPIRGDSNTRFFEILNKINNQAELNDNDFNVLTSNETVDLIKKRWALTTYRTLTNLYALMDIKRYDKHANQKIKNGCFCVFDLFNFLAQQNKQKIPFKKREPIATRQNNPYNWKCFGNNNP